MPVQACRPCLRQWARSIWATATRSPFDIFALEELNYNNPAVSSTLQYLVGQLNSYYGAGTYAYDTYVDPTDGNTTGNGPSGIIYNTHTVMVLSETSLAESSSGAAKVRCRYDLQPVGDSAAAFYLYVSHTKSGTTSSDATRRNIEAQELRADPATLGANAMSSIRATSTPLRPRRTMRP